MSGSLSSFDLRWNDLSNLMIESPYFALHTCRAFFPFYVLSPSILGAA